MERVQPLAPVSGAPKPADDEDDTVVMSDIGLPAVANAGGSLPTVGQIGRYALKYRIGAGGLGTVYAADDPLLSRRVAIKTLNLMPAGVRTPLETDQREPFNAMFMHEARAAAHLSHPHIVTVFDAGLSPQGAYITMELLKGKDLRQLAGERWRPSVGQAALIVRRVADALAYAHSKGIVHRDIKPANIFMVGRTQPKVLDFGIASVAHAREGNTVMGGSPHYMAPEQVRGEPTDRRTDVFSLGVVLYELLCGRRAFAGDSLESIKAAVCEHEPPAAYLVAGRVPTALSDIAARAMAKRPEDRYRSARALARELHDWLQQHPEAVQSVEDESLPLPSRWRQTALVGVAAFGAALLGMAAWQQLAAPDAVPSLLARPALPTATAPAGATTPATAAAPARPVPPSPLPAGTLQFAVSPWAEVEIDGQPLGTVPLINQLSLPAGRHTVVLRNGAFEPYQTQIEVEPEATFVLKYRFGP